MSCFMIYCGEETKDGKTRDILTNLKKIFQIGENFYMYQKSFGGSYPIIGEFSISPPLKVVHRSSAHYALLRQYMIPIHYDSLR